MTTDNFKKSLKIIFESANLFAEEEAPKKEFIHTTPDGAVFKIQVEEQEGEFYVFDKNGKQIDLFNMALVDQDGVVPKATRHAIVDQFKSVNASANGEGEEVKVAEATAKQNAETVRMTAPAKPAPTPAQSAETVKIVKQNEDATDKQNAETVKIVKPESKPDPKTAETVKVLNKQKALGESES
jgi:hypothetical protein